RFTQIDNQLDLGREGGHSKPRVVHARDLTGREIERALLKACRSAPTIDIFRDHMAMDLITYTSGGREVCAGLFVFNVPAHEFDLFLAPVTLLATGGLGQVYFHTTNPLIATGDGLAIAYRAGVAVANLEFIQFHPTTLYNPGRWPFLISEAVRGEGGILKSVDGREIMKGTHPDGDLAPRDIVARTIDRELKAGGEEYVLLDISHLDSDFIKQRFPNIYRRCLRRGFDITERPLPVVPSAHYSCGGIVSTIHGETELPGLYTAGELAMTGMHGANRLASNSLLEAVVMAKLAAGVSSEYFDHTKFPAQVPVDNPLYSSLSRPQKRILIAHNRRQLNRIMSDFAGIVRTEEHLSLALDKVTQICNDVEQHFLATSASYNILELRNMATTARLIIESALQRKESRGLHHVQDYPETKAAFAHDTVVAGKQRKGD
ncbi:MAG: FAD-binding protein, partial [candidate division Zixibacteria bacterium]|nr:FAD-binding protein [candidate division Zixibacteria bacterium]